MLKQKDRECPPEDAVPRKHSQLDPVNGVVRYFTVRETLDLIYRVRDLEKKKWQAVIENDQVKVVRVTRSIDQIQERLQEYEQVSGE